MRIPLLLADFIHARACIPKCEKFLTRPKEQIEKMFALTPITPNVWESARDKFIQFIEAKAKEPSSCSQ